MVIKTFDRGLREKAPERVKFRKEVAYRLLIEDQHRATVTIADGRLIISNTLRSISLSIDEFKLLYNVLEFNGHV